MSQEQKSSNLTQDSRFDRAKALAAYMALHGTNKQLVHAWAVAMKLAIRETRK